MIGLKLGKPNREKKLRRGRWGSAHPGPWPICRERPADLAKEAGEEAERGWTAGRTIGPAHAGAINGGSWAGCGGVGELGLREGAAHAEGRRRREEPARSVPPDPWRWRRWRIPAGCGEVGRPRSTGSGGARLPGAGSRQRRAGRQLGNEEATGADSGEGR